MEERPLRPEREQTDESLRIERARTDEELATRVIGIEADADESIDRARADAADALQRAREAVDGALATPVTVAIVEARQRDDIAAASDQRASDEALHRVREDHLQNLLRLLPLEREKTDQFLLTERARSDQAVSNRDDFLSIVSHDLRNLLGTVAMGARLIEQDASSSGAVESTVEMARRIQRVAARMTRLVADLVDVSSLEAGKLAMFIVRCDATVLVAEAVDAFRPAAAANGLSLESEHVEPALVGAFDHDRVLQVLANLIGNAVKFTPSGGLIRVSAMSFEGGLRLSVRDTGPGIPEAQREAVFRRFWQAGANDLRGLGLGLYIASGIVEAHGGKIWVESKMGQGSTFHFTLSMTTPPLAA